MMYVQMMYVNKQTGYDSLERIVGTRKKNSFRNVTNHRKKPEIGEDFELSSFYDPEFKIVCMGGQILILL